MAVTFTQGSFIIEVKTATNPMEDWLATQEQLIDCLQSENIELHGERYAYLELLRSMQPDLATAKKMLE
ncbi:MAG: hypothetical protein JZU65_06155 [Chlorobium sp.]|nr:hypothetical protein [Chlorobium sp.]